MGKISTFVLADCIIFCGKSKYAFCFPGGFLLKNCNAPYRGRLLVDPPACGAERLDEWYSFPTRTVGADSIRPRHKAPLSGCFVPGRLLVDPY